MILIDNSIPCNLVNGIIVATLLNGPEDLGAPISKSIVEIGHIRFDIGDASEKNIRNAEDMRNIFIDESENKRKFIERFGDNTGSTDYAIVKFDEKILVPRDDNFKKSIFDEQKINHAFGINIKNDEIVKVDNTIMIPLNNGKTDPAILIVTPKSKDFIYTTKATIYVIYDTKIYRIDDVMHFDLFKDSLPSIHPIRLSSKDFTSEKLLIERTYEITIKNK